MVDRDEGQVSRSDVSENNDVTIECVEIMEQGETNRRRKPYVDFAVLNMPCRSCRGENNGCRDCYFTGTVTRF